MIEVEEEPDGPEKTETFNNIDNNDEPKPLKFCPYCKKSFDLPSKFVAHLMTHVQTSPKKKSFNFQCPICMKSYSRRSSLNIHQKIHEKTSSNIEEITPDYIDETETDDIDEDQNNRENIRKRPSKPTKLELKRAKIDIGDEESTTNYNDTEMEDIKYDSITNSQLTNDENVSESVKINLDPIVIMEKLVLKSFKCQFCPKFYTEEDQLKIHLLSDHNNNNNNNNDTNNSVKTPRKSIPKDQNRKLNNCEFCPKSFARPSELMRHVKVHSQSLSFHCPTCSRPFSRKQNLNVHMKTHQNVKPFKCQHCQNFYSRKIDLDMHNEMFHSENKTKIKPDKKIHNCSNCSKSYTSKQNLQNHERSQHSSSVLLLVNDLDVHLKKFHKDQDQLIKGPIEQKTDKIEKFQSYKTENNVPISTDQDSNENQYKCPFCDESFSKRKRLKKHLDRTHMGEENPFERNEEIPEDFSCAICLEKFLNENSLADHNKGHYEVEVNYICQFCKESFKKMKKLEKHIEKVHVNVKSLQNTQKSNGTSPASPAAAAQLAGTGSTKKAKSQLKPKGDISNLFLCPMCPKKLSGQEALIKHSSKHRDFFIM